MKKRLDQRVMELGLTSSRSQAESYIKLGKVNVNGAVVKKSGFFVELEDRLELTQSEQYVSRAGLKLASIAATLHLNFTDKTVLDVGSSTGGFTDYALRFGAKKVIAVDVGTNQLHPSLRLDNRVELYEQTDVRNIRLMDVKLNSENAIKTVAANSQTTVINEAPDIVLIDVSFISLRDILPSVIKLCHGNTIIVAMVKPQFEAGKEQVSKGIIKNDSIRRQILKDFELWAKRTLVIKDKADSQIAGAKGNLERFYSLALKSRSS